MRQAVCGVRGAGGLWWTNAWLSQWWVTAMTVSRTEGYCRGVLAREAECSDGELELSLFAVLAGVFFVLFVG